MYQRDTKCNKMNRRCHTNAFLVIAIPLLILAYHTTTIVAVCPPSTLRIGIPDIPSIIATQTLSRLSTSLSATPSYGYGSCPLSLITYNVTVTHDGAYINDGNHSVIYDIAILPPLSAYALRYSTQAVNGDSSSYPLLSLVRGWANSVTPITGGVIVRSTSSSSIFSSITRLDQFAALAILNIVPTLCMTATDVSSIGSKYAQIQQLLAADVNYTSWNIVYLPTFGGTDDNIVNAVVAGTCSVAFVRSFTIERMVANGQLAANSVAVISDRRSEVIISTADEWPADVAISTNAFPIFTVLATSLISTTVASAITAILLSDTGMRGSGANNSTEYSWSLPQSDSAVAKLAADLQLFSFVTCGAGNGRDTAWPYLCDTCSVGYWSSATAEYCVTCPANTYSNTTGATYCLPCTSATMALPQCAISSTSTGVIVIASAPFFWSSAYAPLTVALIIFAVVAIIIGVTCCILWRRRRGHEKTLAPTKSYRLSIAPPSNVSNNENGHTSANQNGNHHGSHGGPSNGVGMNNRGDAFSQAISPGHRWSHDVSHSPNSGTTPNGRTRASTKSVSPAVTVWHDRSDRIRTGMFAETIPPPPQRTSGHETSVTIIDNNNGDTARTSATPNAGHYSLHYAGMHRSSTSGGGGLLSERDLLSPILGEGGKHQPLSRQASQAIGIDTLNHVIQLRESMTSPLSPNLVPNGAAGTMTAHARAALGYDQAIGGGNGNNNGGGASHTTTNGLLSAPIVGPGEIPSPSPAMNNMLAPSPQRSGSRNRLRMHTSAAASGRSSMTGDGTGIPSLTIHTGNHSPQQTPAGHGRTVSNLSLLAATREAAAIAAAEQLVISSLKGENAAALTAAAQSQSPPSPPPPSLMERRPSKVFDRRPSGVMVHPVVSNPSPTARPTSTNTNGLRESPRDRMLHASASSISPTVANGGGALNNPPVTSTSTGSPIHSRPGSSRGSSAVVPLLGVTLPMSSQPMAPSPIRTSLLANSNTPTSLASHSSTSSGGNDDHSPSVLQLAGHPGMPARKNSFNHLSAVAAVLAAATAASSVADITRPAPSPVVIPLKPLPSPNTTAIRASHHNVVTAREEMMQSPSNSVDSQSCSLQNKQVMISYSHKDGDFAKKVAAALKEAEFKVWIDTDITPGEDWRSDIAHAIEGSFAVVFILSPFSVASKYCKEEIYYATNLKRHVFPIVATDCFKHLRGGFKMLLQRIQWINFEQKGWAPSFAQLLERLRAPPSEGKARPSQWLPEEVAPVAELREHSQPMIKKEVYICYSENEAKDATLARRLFADLKTSGCSVVLAARTPPPATSGVAAGSGPNTPLPIRRGSTAGMTRRQSSVSWDANGTLLRRPSTDLLALPNLGGGGVAWPGSSLSSPVPSSPRAAAPSLPTVTDDLWEQNAKEIDASAMILFIASETSLTSPECADEIHYAYESEKLIIQLNVRSGESNGPNRKRSSFVLEGSMAMMLARTSTVDFAHQSYDLSLLDINVMVTTVRREIARKHANAPVRSPPNVMRPRPWEKVRNEDDSPDLLSENENRLEKDTDATRSRYHLPDRVV